MNRREVTGMKIGQNRMKWLLPVVVCLLLAGCDFTVPLSGKPETAIDKQAVGLWERVLPDGDTERLLVMVLNEREYVLCWPKGAGTELFARAHLFEYSGRTLVQLQWFGNSEGAAPDDDRVFQIAAYSVAGDVLEIRMLNSDVTGKDFRSSGELARAIENNHANPALYSDVMIFKRQG